MKAQAMCTAYSLKQDIVGLCTPEDRAEMSRDAIAGIHGPFGLILQSNSGTEIPGSNPQALGSAPSEISLEHGHQGEYSLPVVVPTYEV